MWLQMSIAEGRSGAAVRRHGWCRWPGSRDSFGHHMACRCKEAACCQAASHSSCSHEEAAQATPYGAAVAKKLHAVRKQHTLAAITRKQHRQRQMTAAVARKQHAVRQHHTAAAVTRCADFRKHCFQSSLAVSTVLVISLKLSAACC